MTDDQILAAAKIIETKRRKAEYHQTLHKSVVGFLEYLDPALMEHPLTLREQSSLTIQTSRESTGYLSSEDFRLDSDLAKELLDSLECILSKKEQLL
tara:strand:+ start:192 stop:482 length:291 start_codon:yes stop_codon:yes gene_type:complete